MRTSEFIFICFSPSFQNRDHWFIIKSTFQNLLLQLGSQTLFILLPSCIFFFPGGLAAVIYTDTLQFFVMIIGATVVAIKGTTHF